MEAEPQIKPADLANYANGLLARKGFDYQFDLCEFVALHNPPRRNAASLKTYKLPLKQTDGSPITFLTTANEKDGDGMCGECFFGIPIMKVTRQEIELVTGGKKYLLTRPPSFHLDEMDLVDQSMRRVLRTWQIPSQNSPLGISVDGTKLYLETEIEALVLELSELGPRLVTRAELDLPAGVEIEKHPTDAKNAYLSFMRFRVGSKTYIIRYSGPCT